MPSNLSKVPEGVQPAVKQKAAEIVAQFDADIRNVWGYASFPDHSNRRCVDYMILSEAGGDRIAQYHIDNAKRLNVNWVIWNRRIYRYQNTNRGHGWAAYTGPKSHTDHVHVEYAEGSYTPPPDEHIDQWDGKSFPGASAFKLGQRHDAVTLLGKMLVKAGYGRFYKVGPGPVFGEADRNAVEAFQRAQGWSGSDADGYPGRETWTRLSALLRPAVPQSQGWYHVDPRKGSAIAYDRNGKAASQANAPYDVYVHKFVLINGHIYGQSQTYFYRIEDLNLGQDRRHKEKP
jgi:peptidoglycan hydrolase-like protein with peptidoglycan-binding domain